jgi:hypothetical protein
LSVSETHRFHASFHDGFPPAFAGVNPSYERRILDGRAALRYHRVMFVLCTMLVSSVDRGRAAGPGALRMR